MVWQQDTPEIQTQTAPAVIAPPDPSIPNDLAELIATYQYSRFSGPLPPPEILQKYNKTFPGAAQQLIEMAQKQSEHRMKIEEMVVRSDITRSYLGLIAGLIVTLACIITGGVVAVHDYPTTGGIIATGCVVTLASVFMYGTHSRKSERAERVKTLAKSDGSEEKKPE